MSGVTRCLRCGGRRGRPVPLPRSWLPRGTGSVRTPSRTCYGPRGSACRPTPRPSRAGSTPTATRSFATSTSRSKPTRAVASRWSGRADY